MKKILLCMVAVACLLPLAGFAQVDSHANDPGVAYYVDSILVDQSQLGYINPKNIDEVVIVKEGEGAIYIDLKPGVAMLTLDDVVRKYLSMLPEDKSSRMYIIDNKVVLDPSKVTIDKSYIKKVRQTSLDEAPYLKSALQKMTVITIELSPDGDKKEFRIRGLTAN